MSVNAISTNTSGARSMGLGGMSASADSEYEDIKKQLQKLGIKPTGNKQVDKAKLTEAKQSMQAMKNKSASNKNGDKAQKQQEAAATSMTGAQNMADLNKYLLGLS